MSSLAAARADNFYHPPNWDPRKESRAQNATRGQPKWKSHPLRERAKKADEGILQIRFEMPFHVRCKGCGNHIGKGVRYDADKKAVGKYLSTKIWSFRMMCKCEDGTSRTDQRKNPHFIEIHTDPRNADYVIVEGAVKVEETTRSAAELGVETLLDPEEQARRAADPFYKLEHAPPSEQQTRKKRGPWLEELQAVRDEDWRDDYALNRQLRRAHRARRGEDRVEEAMREAKGIRVALPPEHPADIAASRELAASGALGEQAQRARRDAARSGARLRLTAGSIFGGGSASGGGGGAGAAALAVRGPTAAQKRPRADEPKCKAQGEAERLRLLALRKARGMAIAPNVAPPPARAPVPRFETREARAGPAPLVAYSDDSDS